MSIQTILAGLGADIAIEAAKVGTELAALGVQLVETGVADIEQVFSLGAPVAVQAVIAEAPKVISGEEKFGNAVATVVQTLEAKVGPVAVADVQSLVQMAYRGLQKITSGD